MVSYHHPRRTLQDYIKPPMQACSMHFCRVSIRPPFQSHCLTDYFQLRNSMATQIWTAYVLPIWSYFYMAWCTPINPNHFTPGQQASSNLFYSRLSDSKILALKYAYIIFHNPLLRTDKKVNAFFKWVFPPWMIWKSLSFLIASI